MLVNDFPVLHLCDRVGGAVDVALLQDDLYNPLRRGPGHGGVQINPRLALVFLVTIPIPAEARDMVSITKIMASIIRLERIWPA